MILHLHRPVLTSPFYTDLRRDANQMKLLPQCQRIDDITTRKSWMYDLIPGEDGFDETIFFSKILFELRFVYKVAFNHVRFLVMFTMQPRIIHSRALSHHQTLSNLEENWYTEWIDTNNYSSKSKRLRRKEHENNLRQVFFLLKNWQSIIWLHFCNEWFYLAELTECNTVFHFTEIPCKKLDIVFDEHMHSFGLK
jgi:hypothetical protein